VGGRQLFPQLKVVFAAGAGLAPVLVERHALRGGGRTTVDPDVFVDTSGTGGRALEAIVRVLGIDALVLGSDRPYGEPLEEFLGDAATHAVRVTNPSRLLEPGARQPGGEQAWAVAS
jgi:predicted TIM-barrel fold metal-dependent hydrolase